MKIVIPGGSGQVGRVLARHFHEAGHQVIVLTRHPEVTPWRTVYWDGSEAGEWTQELEGAAAVINLAGRSVNCRYTARNRREILDSRIETTRLIGKTIAKAANPPPLWINASTATIYRHTFDRAMDEATGELGGSEPDAQAAWHFSIDVATAWERTFFEAATPHTRKIALRSAMTMSPGHGGVFNAFYTLVRCGLGGPLASGRQFVSWIHYADFIRAVEFLMARPEIDGVVNVCSPNPLPNRGFMRLLREAAGVPFGLGGSAWMLEIAAFLHRTETELLLKSRRVVPGRLLQAGFTFQFPEWREAALDLTGRARPQTHRIEQEAA
jgi:uncharacterized protein (TIGR01777 family)